MSERARDTGAAPAVRAIVAGHGEFATGLVSAVEAITGRGAVYFAISGRGMSAAAIEDAMRRALDETGARIIFTDLHAGSCTMAARRVLRDRTDVLFIAGANLPMLLDFAMSSEPEPMDAAQHAIECGRAAITTVGGRPR